MELTGLNWPALLAGTAVAYVLGFVWFSPLLFGKAWVAGSHNIAPPEKPPLDAMALMLAGTFLLALVVAITATQDMLITAIAAIAAAAALVAGMDRFSAKNAAATLIDSCYVLASGTIMIAAQGIL